MKTKLFWIIFAALLVIGFFLRTYRISETLMFLSDQGRDAIVLKRLVTFEKMVFVGPTTSIGNVFTGPFYYYLVAPFMALWMLNPVGPAYGVAIINTFGLGICAYFVSKLFNRKIAIVFLLLTTISANQILQSRFSWNPNPLPIFSFGTILAFFAARKTQKKLYYIITGLLFGISLQLHYIAIAVPFFVFGFLSISRKSISITETTKKFILGIAIVVITTIFTFTPLILFEIKNGFINTKTFINASSTSEVQAKNTGAYQRFADTGKGFLSHTFSIEIFDSYQALGVFLILFFLTAFIAWKQKDASSIFARGALLVILANILALSRLETGRHIHYYNPSYLASFFICGYVFDKSYRFLKNKYWQIIIVVIFALTFGIFAYRQVPNLTFIFEPHKTHTQLTHAESVARYILSKKESPMYQVVGLPFYETEGHYRYYLEVLGQRPMPSDSLGDPKELFVICHELNKRDCDIPGNAQWQLADFQNKHPKWKFDKPATKTIDNVRVYKLIY